MPREYEIESESDSGEDTDPDNYIYSDDECLNENDILQQLQDIQISNSKSQEQLRILEQHIIKIFDLLRVHTVMLSRLQRENTSIPKPVVPSSAQQVHRQVVKQILPRS